MVAGSELILRSDRVLKYSKLRREKNKNSSLWTSEIEAEETLLPSFTTDFAQNLRLVLGAGYGKCQLVTS